MSQVKKVKYSRLVENNVFDGIGDEDLWLTDCETQHVPRTFLVGMCGVEISYRQPSPNHSTYFSTTFTWLLQEQFSIAFGNQIVNL